MNRKILHITSWYPNSWNDIEGIFIHEHYRLYSKVFDSHLINVQIKEGKKIFEYQHREYSKDEEGYYIFTKIKSQKIIELLTTFLLLWVLFKSSYKNYNLIHFHIAYPLLIDYFLWKKIIKVPILISEHWSVYHFNFYMPLSTKKLNGIKRIFRQNIPLVTVSKALLKDIEEFVGVKIAQTKIIPNAIDENCFYFKKTPSNKVVHFFIVNHWRKIKNPFPLLEGFAKLASSNIDFILNIGGAGELEEEMKIFVKRYGFEDKVQFFGKMNKVQIAEQLYRSDAYLYSSEYETFSVVSAQALCCGIPLIGPAIPAILEYTDETSLLALEENTPIEWERVLKNFIANRDNYNHKQIAENINLYLSSSSIQKSYKDLINEWF
ncbi:MAG: glycosyltransferase family 4 protein [Sulfurovum sp.]